MFCGWWLACAGLDPHSGLLPQLAVDVDFRRSSARAAVYSACKRHFACDLCFLQLPVQRLNVPGDSGRSPKIFMTQNTTYAVFSWSQESQRPAQIRGTGLEIFIS